MAADITTNNLTKELAKDAKLRAAVGAVLNEVASTAALASVTNDINVVGKYAGKRVFNTTTNILVVATGATAASTWVNSGSGVVAHTPV